MRDFVRLNRTICSISSSIIPPFCELGNITLTWIHGKKSFAFSITFLFNFLPPPSSHNYCNLPHISVLRLFQTQLLLGSQDIARNTITETNSHTYLPTYLPACLPTYLHTCLYACIHACTHACMPTLQKHEHIMCVSLCISVPMYTSQSLTL